MWSLFARDPLKDFGFEINNEVLGKTKSQWELHKGVKKSTGENVTVFIYEVKQDGMTLANAKAAVKRLKTLRHPSILKYIDSLELEKSVYLITEQVESLEAFLNNTELTLEHKNFAISWGLHQIAKGLWFLSNDCSLSHNNVCLESIFVSQSGDWYLGGTEFVSTASEGPPLKPQSLRVYNPPEWANGGGARNSQPWSTDSWGLGCLIWETFNGSLPDASCLKSPGKVPKSLTKMFHALCNLNSNNRISPKDFLTECRLGFMKNAFVDAMIFLEEIQMKESAEISTFFSGLANLLDSFPNNACKYKILPQMLNAYEFGNAGSTILNPIFKIGKLLNEEEYQKRIVPCVVKLFSSKDRSTRAKLLQQMDQFIDHLQPNLVNEQIFPHVSQGFLDTNPTIREQTIKCMLHLAPKLNYNNLNEEVMKHFARLQVKDDQGGIRTNTTVCLGKISCYLAPTVRQKVLIPAFGRSLRDPFPPSRIAGIIALSSTQSFYSLQDSAKKILPLLCQLTVDPEKSVREQAFGAIKGYLGKLEKVSEDPTLTDELESEVNAITGSASSSSLASSLAGWAVTSITSKFYKGGKIKIEKQGSTNSVEEPSTKSENSSADKTIPPSINSPEELQTPETESDWGSSPSSPLDNDQNGWEGEDDWQDFDVTIKEETSSTKVSQREAWDSWNDDFKEPDDLEETKRKREEKKQQRRSEQENRRTNKQAAKGPLKLGARKMN